MKKFIAIVLALTFVLALAGCNNETGNETTAPQETTAPVETTVPQETTAPVETTEPTVAVMTYAEFDAAAIDDAVVIETYVQAVESWYEGVVQIYAQSEDGGYYIYNLACTQEDAAKFVPGTKIRVSGFKAEWSGEIEIVDATYEILEGSYTAPVTDVTAVMGTDELASYMNQFVAIKGATVVASKDANGNEAPFLYKWDGSGSQGSDLYFNVSVGDQVYTFTVNVYMIGTGVDSDVYKAVEALKVGDVIDLEGFLYWYNGAQPHITSVTVAAN